QINFFSIYLVGKAKVFRPYVRKGHSISSQKLNIRSINDICRMITQHTVQKKRSVADWFVSEHAVVAIAVLAVFASFWSKFLISMSILLFVLLAIPHIITRIKNLKKSRQRPALYVLSLPFRDIVCGSLILIFLGTSISAL